MIALLRLAFDLALRAPECVVLSHGINMESTKYETEVRKHASEAVATSASVRETSFGV